MAIFGTFWPFLLLEPFGLYLSMLHVERMRLFHPFEKMVKVLVPKNHQKLKKNWHSECYAGHFGPFFQVFMF